MTRQHLCEDGELRRCTTTPDKCTKRGPDGQKAPHFDSKKEAEKFFEEEAKNNSKNSTGTNLNGGGLVSAILRAEAERHEELKTNPYVNAPLRKFSRVMDAYNASKDPNASEEDLYVLSKMYNGYNDILSNVLNNKHTPKQGLAAITKALSAKRSDIWREAAALVEHPNCSSEVVDILATANDGEARAHAAACSKISPKMLDQLITDEDFNVRASTAENTSMTEKQFLKLIEVNNGPNDYLVLEHIARQSHVPEKILNELANNKNSHVRSEVAMNTKSSAKILAKLAKDKDEQVVNAVLNNPRCPMKVLLEHASRNATDEENEDD